MQIMLDHLHAIALLLSKFFIGLYKCQDFHPSELQSIIAYCNFLFIDYGVFTCAGYPGSLGYIEQDAKVSVCCVFLIHFYVIFI